MIADEVMAGFGRCGEWFAVDHWGVTPDLITFAKGVNSGYVPLGGVDHLRRRSPTTFAERRLPRRPHLLRPPAGLRLGGRLHQDLQGGGHRRARPQPRRRRDRPRAARARRAAPVASARSAASACSGRSSWSATARPASRWCRSTPPARPPRPMDEFAGGLQGARAVAVHPLQPHRTSCRRARPPPTRSREGLAILDEALDVADRYYTGS